MDFSSYFKTHFKAKYSMFIVFTYFFSDSTYAYCNENGLNFSASAAAYSEDDADFTPGRRGKASRVSTLELDGAQHIWILKLYIQ